ncbi:MAG: sulfatase-like hydrolase/transferase [Bryobacterales bacterium]|nr:sulfatase-like hydrolase/transferase [Bryobacterales bacterium]
MLNRRQFTGAAAGAAITGAGMAQSGARKPNIVFIFSDDHHYQCLGAAGNPHIQTPNLDRLAAHGVNFTHAMISTSQCCPSRGVMLSGLETYQSGLQSNGYTAFKPGYPPTVIEQLRRSGYDTNLVGKWHITNMPKDCGFASAPLWLRGGGSKYVDPMLRRGLDGKDEETKGHITDLLTDAAVGVIEKSSKEKPFFLWLTYNAPHTPWTAVEPYKSQYAGKAQPPPAHPSGGQALRLGHLLRRDFAPRCRRGPRDRSVGKSGAVGEHARLLHWRQRLPLRHQGLNGKVHPWDESVRVPYIVSGGVVKARGKQGAPVCSIDAPATWMDFAGVKPAYKLSGVTLREELIDGHSRHEHGFAVWNDGRPEGLAIKVAVEPYRLVRTRFYKYILWESKREALYEPDKDPGEVRNLAEKPSRLHKQVIAEMRGALEERMVATDDPARAWMR